MGSKAALPPSPNEEQEVKDSLELLTLLTILKMGSIRSNFIQQVEPMRVCDYVKYFLYEICISIYIILYI